MIPTEAVAAACEAYHANDEEPFEGAMRAALEAAAPHMLAGALEDAAKLAEMGEGGGTDSGECDDWSTWLRARAATERGEQ